MNYTQAQIDRANAVSLEDFLRSQERQLLKSGREYRWKEHDSLTVRGNKWFRHSQSKGGYPIDFVMEFYGKSFPEAVELLTGEHGEAPKTAPPMEFRLPKPSRTADRTIQYLCEVRGLSKQIVETFLLSGIFTRTAATTTLSLWAGTETVSQDMPMPGERQTASGRTFPALTSPMALAMWKRQPTLCL